MSYNTQVTNRGLTAVKTNVRHWGYIREWGTVLIQIPAFNQYRRHRDAYPLAKASHWGNLRRQDIASLEVRVGRTSVIDGIIAKNGYGDVLLFSARNAITFLFCQKN